MSHTIARICVLLVTAASTTGADGSPRGGLSHRLDYDRSGATINSMLFAEVWARRYNLQLLGSYENLTITGRKNETHIHSATSRSLVRFLGLPETITELPKDVVRVSWIKPFLDEVDTIFKENPTANVHIEGRLSWGNANEMFPRSLRQEWRDRAQLTVPRLWSPAALRVAVHVRRGDLLGNGIERIERDRLLPNHYYLRVLELIRQVEPAAEIVVFGDVAGNGARLGKFSMDEPGYRQEEWGKMDGVKFRLDGPLEEAWNHIIQADVMIASKSAFSYVPALISDAVVVYAPAPQVIGYGDPLDHWIVTDAPNPWEPAVDEQALLAEVDLAVNKVVQQKLQDALHAKLQQKTSKLKAKGEL